MKKYVFIGIVVCVLGGISLVLYAGLASDSGVDEAVKLEDAIIIHGIEMDSETPVAENEAEGEGRIIIDDSFDDTIIDYDRVKQQKGKTVISKNEMKEFDRLQAKDRRWHLCRYRIRKNDNLWNIARRFGVHQHLIISINSIDDPDKLKPGRFINVPSRRGIYYKVLRGDTVSRIAGRYRIAGKNIIAHNGLTGRFLKPGQKLFLPDVRESDARIVTARTDSRKKGAAVVASIPRIFTWPIRGRITSGFGTRVDPFTRDRRFHCGIDISANVGTPIRAAGNGRIIFNGWKPGYGKVVIIRHEGGYITVYAHNSRNMSPVDSEVSRGDVIAYSGMTGAVTGAHVHFEVRKYVNPLNPMRFLK
ncbi:MAG TPA: M23 family metallopeptidase [Spirochaetota bacterium]|mgnify:CR=1 FL=1|nr:M23 family metallopeptidase [Spirochaetota bacterium]HOD14175.1 M23 family metallopeptidase [Spirochaetota bacterium]HPG52180.1 M23 family metallopeptidase [Spirochaetota bacterium]HPN13123.1 M23 family metallopeptidase [Spirochaetota bacterium]HQL82829.1 M23 family metallopeptidase [Spirochaetota bacterium]